MTEFVAVASGLAVQSPSMAVKRMAEIFMIVGGDDGMLTSVSERGVDSLKESGWKKYSYWPFITVCRSWCYFFERV